MRLLVIAAHVDDEALLCGGTIHKASHRGHEVTVAFCSRNQKGRGPEERVQDRRRRAEDEAAKSSSLLGFDPSFLDFEDMRLGDEPGRLLQALITTIRSVRPDLLISHVLTDWHIDHRTLGGLVPEAALQGRYALAGGAPWRPAAVLQGEVDLEGLAPFSYHLVSRLDDPDVEAKLAAVETYYTISTDHGVEMQTLRRSLAERAALRGRTVGAAAGEAFALSPLLPLDGRALQLLSELIA